MNKRAARDLAEKGPTIESLRSALESRQRLAGLAGTLDEPSRVNPSLTVRQALGVLTAGIEKYPPSYVITSARDVLIATNVLRECL